MFVEVESSTKDLHSGCFGGAVHEAMNDLVYLLNQLVDPNGKILVPGVYDKVCSLTQAERDKYDTIDFDPAEYLEETGCFKLMHKDKVDTLMHRWRFPSLTIHGNFFKNRL